jgi:hypothetical protein
MIQAFDVLDMLLAEKLLRGHHCRNFAMKIEDPTLPNFVKYLRLWDNPGVQDMQTRESGDRIRGVAMCEMLGVLGSRGLGEREL